MNHPHDSFHLTYDQPSGWIKRPRLAWLVCGLVLIAVGLATPQTVGLSGRWAAWTVVEVYVLFGGITLIGVFMAAYALFSDQLHIQQIRVHPQGLSISWSHVPELWLTRLERWRELKWSDVDRIDWEEGSQEHDFKQYLVLYLLAPLNRRQTRIKVMLCESRDYLWCESLLSHVPRRIQAPMWFVTTQARRRGQIT
jgi:hypothetical protein